MRKSIGLFFGIVVLALNLPAQTLPSVSVVATDPSATEPGFQDMLDTGLFTITREGPTNMPMLVFFALSGTASNGVDYVKFESPVTIPEGARAVRLQIQPIQDRLVEGDERVILRLTQSPLAGAGSGYILPTNSSVASVVIHDWNPPTNALPNVNIVQPANGAAFTAPANIHIVADTFDPNGWVGTVEFFANDDKIGESVITFIVEPQPGTPITHEFDWNGVRPGAYLLTARAIDNAGASRLSLPVNIAVRDTNVFPRTVVSIVATDPEGSEIPEVPPGMEMPQRYDPAIFAVTRTGSVSNALTVFYSIGGTAINGVDYAELPGRLEIPAGARSANIEVSVIDDKLVEGTESVSIGIVPPPCIAIYPPPPECYTVGVPGDPRMVNFDDLVPDDSEDGHIGVPPGYGGLDWINFHVINGSALSSDYGYHNGTVSPKNVAFNGAGNPASIRGRNSSFDLRSAYLTAALNNDTELRVRVQGLSRGVVLYDNTYSLNRNTPTLAQFNYSGIDEARFAPASATQFAMDNVEVAIAPPGFAEARILDDDVFASNAPPVIRITTPTNGTVFRAPANVPISVDTVDRDGYVSRVEFYANNFKIGEASKAFLVPPPPGEHISYDFEWKDARAGQYLLTVRGFDDRGAIGFSEPVRISILGTNLPPNTNISIVTIMAPDANASEHETNTATFVVHREGNTNFALLVFYSISGTASNGVDYEALPGSVTMPAGERAARILVTPIDDKTPEPLESVVLSLQPSPLANILPGYIIGSPARAAAIIADNDAPRPPIICLRDGLFHWCRPATNGQCFRIECSTDLVNWRELCNAEAADGAVLYVDADAPTVRMRFYRAIPVPCPMDTP